MFSSNNFAKVFLATIVTAAAFLFQRISSLTQRYNSMIVSFYQREVHLYSPKIVELQYLIIFFSMEVIQK